LLLIISYQSKQTNTQMSNNIHRVAIYPPIGIARVGNSREHFLASDLPNVTPVPENGHFKDQDGKVKKQVARFRVYAFNEAGEVVKEITADEATIEWRVHVANIKAAWYQFNNALDLEGYAIPGAPRNNNITGTDRDQLVIDPGSRTITGTCTQGEQYQLTGGKFFGKEVYLGEVQTDEKGRLLFFGGHGHSASKDNLPPTTFANNDGWHDDTSDGVVRAKVTIAGQEYEAEPAMVATTPPNYAPGLYSAITMYDVVQNLYIQNDKFDYDDPTKDGLIFYDHIYPTLEKMTNNQWVNHGFFMLFGKNSPADFTDPSFRDQLADPSEASKDLRERVFRWFRDPANTQPTPAEVPPFYGDGFGDYNNVSIDNLPLTPTLYAWFKRWAEGDFTTGQVPSDNKPANQQEMDARFEALSLDEQLQALNEAPLEECLGGPFHPGIELTWVMRNANMWKEPFRLNTLPEGTSTPLDFGPLLSPSIALGATGPLSASGPGALTRWMGVPWQTDEASCLSGYTTSYYLSLPSFWAARVPNQVLSNDSYLRMQKGEVNIAQRLKHFDYRQEWLREIDGGGGDLRRAKMVDQWYEMGIMVETDSAVDKDGMLPAKVWKETHNDFKGDDPTFAQVVAAENIDTPAAPEALMARHADDLAEQATTANVTRTRTTHSRQDR
jgi:hypothetical protein